MENNDNPNFAYSKFMKFMKQEGDISVENDQESLPDFQGSSEEWTEQFEKSNKKSEDKVSDNNTEKDEVSNKVEKEQIVADNWIDEFQKESTSSGQCFF